MPDPENLISCLMSSDNLIYCEEKESAFILLFCLFLEYEQLRFKGYDSLFCIYWWCSTRLWTFEIAQSGSKPMMASWCGRTFCTLQWRHNECNGISNHGRPSFAQLLIQAQIKENIKALCHWPLCGETPVTNEFPAQKASNTENVSI